MEIEAQRHNRRDLNSYFMFAHPACFASHAQCTALVRSVFGECFLRFVEYFMSNLFEINVRLNGGRYHSFYSLQLCQKLSTLPVHNFSISDRPTLSSKRTVIILSSKFSQSSMLMRDCETMAGKRHREFRLSVNDFSRLRRTQQHRTFSKKYSWIPGTFCKIPVVVHYVHVVHYLCFTSTFSTCHSSGIVTPQKTTFSTNFWRTVRRSSISSFSSWIRKRPLMYRLNSSWSVADIGGVFVFIASFLTPLSSFRYTPKAKAAKASRIGGLMRAACITEPA